MKKLFLFALSALLLASCACPDKCDTACCATLQNLDSAAVVNAMLGRRSIRKYKPEPVRRDQLDVILQCGINAPSGINRQPWAVRVVENPEFLNACTEVWKAGLSAEDLERQVTSNPDFRNMFRNAPTVVFVAAPEGWGDLDGGMLAENMMVSAWSMGVGTCCLGGFLGFMATPEAAPFVERLQLPEGYHLIYALAMGYPDESPEAKPRDASKIQFIE